MLYKLYLNKAIPKGKKNTATWVKKVRLKFKAESSFKVHVTSTTHTLPGKGQA